jgi:hypothetical protein
MNEPFSERRQFMPTPFDNDPSAVIAALDPAIHSVDISVG